MKIPHKKIINFIALILLLAVLPGTVWVSYQQGMFKIAKIDISSTQENITEAQKKYLNDLQVSLTPYLGTQVWSLPVNEIQNKLSELSWIQNYKVHRRLPNTIRVSVELKPALAIAYDQKGKLRLISQDGDLLPEIDAAQAPSLPVVQESKLWQKKEGRDRLVRILSHLPEEGSLSLREISELSLSDKNEIVLTHLKTKSLLKLGEDQIEVRAARVSKVLEYLEQNDMSWRVIDASYSKKVLVRLRNGR